VPSPVVSCALVRTLPKFNTIHLLQPDRTDCGARTYACSVYTRVNALRFEPRPSFPGARSRDLEALNEQHCA